MNSSNPILRDNSPVDSKELAKRCLEIQRLIDQGNYFLVDLMDLSGLRPGERPQIFRKEEGQLRTGNYVGVFEYPVEDRTESVIIGSRFDEGRAGFFLRAMFEDCWDTPLLFLEESWRNPANNPYDLLLAMRLAMQLERTWKHGQLRLYQGRKQYDSRVQGRLDLPRQIRENMGLTDGRMAYVMREYTEEHVYTILFLKALLEAERIHPDFMRRLREERSRFRLSRQDLLQQASGGERADKHTLLARTKKRITNPVYREYETLRVISRAVLRRMNGYQPMEKDQIPFVTGVFLDISQLWELYLAEKVFSRTSPEPRRDYYQKSVSILEGALNIRPDFWWAEKKIVLDAKYRPVWAEVYRRFPEETRENVYQVLSYMLALDCTRGGVIFPAGSPGQAPKAFQLSGLVQRTFWLAGFAVPAEKADYAVFRGEMDREAERLARDLAGSVFR